MQNVKGTFDYKPNDYDKFECIKNAIRKNAKLLNVDQIDTPILEYTNLLKKGDIGEDCKLIFNIDDDKTSLRYDLTVPLSRYMNMNGLENIRRFQIGKVFRMDSPEIEKGRFREFYQADIDIVGTYEPLMPEIDIFWLINKVMKDLKIVNYEIKYNYRNNLYSMCKLIGITNVNKIKQICATIDKLDKQPWPIIIKELIEIRNLTENQTTQLKEMIDNNFLDKTLNEFDSELNKHCENIIRDSSLARGLDYYTGIIYEVIVLDTNVRTIIAGGRYDKMIFKTKKNGSKQYIPAIGISFGISRIMKVINTFENIEQKRIYIISKDTDIKIKLLTYYRNNNYIADCDKQNIINTIKQITYAVKNNYDYIAIYGENKDKIKIKELNNNNKDNIYDLSMFD
jgi:histidyl-tRNA synthetase